MPSWRGLPLGENFWLCLTTASTQHLRLLWELSSFHYFMMCLSCPPSLRDILHTPMVRYSLFVLKVPLDTNQPNQTSALCRMLSSVHAAESDVASPRVGDQSESADDAVGRGRRGRAGSTAVFVVVVGSSGTTASPCLHPDRRHSASCMCCRPYPNVSCRAVLQCSLYVCACRGW